MKEGPLVNKSFEFSLAIISYCEYLNGKKKFVIANQLMKSGTSIGANVFEAQYPESRLDFIHKMKIALKEANETLYWLSLCEKIEGVYVKHETLKQLNEVILIISKMIVTSKKNLTKS